MKPNAKNFLETFLESKAKELRIDAITLYPYDETMDQFGIPFTYGLREPEAVRGPMTESGVAIKVRRLEQAHFAPNAPADAIMASGEFVKREGIRSSASFPLWIEERKVGILFVNYRTRHYFEDHEKLTLAAFANEVALVLEKDSLLRESEAMRSLHDMAQDALAITDEKTLLDTLVYKVKDTFDFDTVAIYWVDENQKKIIRRYAAGLAEHWSNDGGRGLDEKDILPHVVKTGQPKIISGWDDLLKREVYEKCGHEKLIRIFLPLVIDNKAEGVLEAGNERRNRHFTSPGEQTALSHFVNQACLAVQKARLFRNNEQRTKASEQILDITRQLQAAQSVETVYDIVLNGITEFGFDRARLYLLETDRYLVSVVSRGVRDAATYFDNGKIKIDFQTDKWFGEEGRLKYAPWLPVISRLDESRINPWPFVVDEGVKRVCYLDPTPFEQGHVPYLKELDKMGVKTWRYSRATIPQ
ncbi:GAF domain-containing protein [Candidatus Poribacteria bacterium]|nr:GAF domain-containing protein [Candidatus Poribacteria bacterium]